MKKSGVFLIVMIVIYGFAVVGGADETEVESGVDVEIEEQVQAEVEVMDVSFGAEMRLLQLEFRIRRAILHGEAVINLVRSKGGDK